MIAVVYSARALRDLERLVEFLAHGGVDDAAVIITTIIDAIQVLERHPFIGRPVQGAIRELVISRGRNGYVALYRIVRNQERIEILTVRHQREAGFASGA